MGSSSIFTTRLWGFDEGCEMDDSILSRDLSKDGLVGISREGILKPERD